MSLITNDAEHIFMYFLALVYIFFGETSIQVFCPFYLGHLSFSFKFIYFVYLFLAALFLRCCAWAFSSCSEWGLLFIAVRRLLTVVASLVAERGL